jgi:uncharacterized membrane protein
MTTTPTYKTRATYSKRNILSGVLFGIGLAAFIDETVFHQLLHWHHFYDKSTTSVGLVSDGLFHAFSWFATIWAGFLFSDLRRRNALVLKVWVAGLLLGAGGFQFYDGTIQHKIMRIHQIRYNVDVFPYDLSWNIIAAAMILSGAYLLHRSQRKAHFEGGPSS